MIKMQLYDTLSRTIRPFVPLNDKVVKMYTCGLTVYSQPQIGNWVAYIYSDVLHRALLQAGYSVDRVQNITDVGHLVSDEDSGEDKMEKGAKREGLTAWQVADKYIKVADHEAYELLGLLRPGRLVRATDLISEQIEMVNELEAKGFTYIIENDGVYFDTSKLDDYGKLAKLDIKGLRTGARVSAGNKKHSTDFALWKFSPKDHQRDMEWDSPWGVGFPGWHLECSAIIHESLGDQIDIHTGGIDHIPVHHTNEIAQTESITGKQLSQFWFHNNHIKVNGTKLSKSLGNSYTLNDVATKGYSFEAFKIMVLSSHYRTEGNFTWDILEAAQNRLQGYGRMADMRWQPKPVQQWLQAKNIISDLEDCLLNDLNTPAALALLSNFATDVEDKLLSEKDVPAFTELLTVIDTLLGTTLSKRHDITKEQKEYIQEREDARASKDWSKSDELRDQLLNQGIELRDTSAGTIWYRK